ncbi:hypothetical protein GCM10011351_29250 [Paraliobacillus quinghaiensis]|uniref:Uncharacterized protein n=1 Tax=Paraliobacillus quinghaiensis TaxID=470815 RepID=A0A917WYW1_9BACI|nr:hypothetical protein [Paraliobacillus quinghaiensis]GGM41223.1 hypothetical protein GCM10011351_29250 [Paraliobacillus quinghaiensis]
MGFWYFLILFAGIFLVIKGVRGNKQTSLITVGLLCIALSLFMFSPGSAEFISELFNLE